MTGIRDIRESPTTKVEGVVKEPAPVEVTGRYYLLVFKNEKSWMVQLPTNGSLVIGRADDADLQLKDKAVSRKHARLTMSDGLARISDLGSQNGVWVNGERIKSPRPLSSGDAITISDASLIYHANNSGRTAIQRPMLDSVTFRLRVVEELERANRYGRELVVAVIIPGDSGGSSFVEEAVLNAVRLIDVVAVDSHDRGRELPQIYVLLPETGTADAETAVERVRSAACASDPQSRVGYACSPGDGNDPNSLLTSARDAAREAGPGEYRAANSASRVFSLGGVDVVVAEPSMLRLYALVERLAASHLPVLITGETGTGKELAASAIHYWSDRAGGPFVTLNCAALQEGLVESELFGHERGAFTGAVSSKPGLLEAGSGGTVFLDEIGELTATAQAKLLRVLETKRVMRVGDVREREIDIRIVAATHHNIEQEAREGRFRQDLFFRLSGATVWLPPLRDRPRELPLLARSLLGAACKRVGRGPLEISVGAMRTLTRYEWPGNVRELRNVMDYLAATVPGDELEANALRERLVRRGHAPSPDDVRRARERVRTGSSRASARAGSRPSSSGSRASSRPASAPGERAPSSGSTARVDSAPRGDSARGRAPSRPDASTVESPAPPKTFRPIAEEVRELEIRRMSEALEATGGVQTQAAGLIDMPLRTFVNKLKRYGLSSGRKR